MKYLLDTDHVSILQRPTGAEYANLAGRMAQHAPADFAFSVVSFHEQMLGAHTFIVRARTTSDLIRGYMLLLEILQGFLAAPVLAFDDRLVVLSQRAARLDPVRAVRWKTAAERTKEVR